MKTSIALIGFMGTGKTAVGRLLAEKLSKEFIELDSEIEKTVGKTVAAIFSDDGEARFRKLEVEAVQSVSGRENVVIACGGGVVLDKENVFRLKRECVIVCLTASPEMILRRVSSDKYKRPLLDVPDREKRIKELLDFRRPLYDRAADISIDTTGIDAPAVVEKILNALSDYENRCQ